MCASRKAGQPTADSIEPPAAGEKPTGDDEPKPPQPAAAADDDDDADKIARIDQHRAA